MLLFFSIYFQENGEKPILINERENRDFMETKRTELG